MNCASTGLVSRKSSVPLRTYSVIRCRLGEKTDCRTPLTAKNRPTTTSSCGYVHPATESVKRK
jgi:hypothetical protein